jgi:hypothetical protein
MQGPRAVRGGKIRNDMGFREELTELREIWQETMQGTSNLSDGFFLINELRIPRKRKTYPIKLIKSYNKALRKIAQTLHQPIRYAGPKQYTVFEKPKQLKDIEENVIRIPGTQTRETCLIINNELWDLFQRLSLWIESLCIHEWCIFTERQKQIVERKITRGEVFNLLTARKKGRTELRWEREQINGLMRSYVMFTCPWTKRKLRRGLKYEIDHILPVSIYPINELWNLVPAHPEANARKRDRLPTKERMENAKGILHETYSNYGKTRALSNALHEDVALRFISVKHDSKEFHKEVALATTNFIDMFGNARNLPRY